MDLRIPYKIAALAAGMTVYGLLIFWSVASGSLLAKIAAAGFPVLLLSGYLAICRPRVFALMLVFLLPLSINLENVGIGVGLSIPGEILAGIMALLMAIHLIHGFSPEKRIWTHPVTILLGIHLAWMAISSFTGSMPAVSLKFLVVRIVYILVFYLFLIQVMNGLKDIRKFFWIYTASLMMVIIYALVRHAQFSYIQEVSAWAPRPFYKDHTIYGACMAMVLPFFIFRVFLPSGSRILPGLLSLPVCAVLLAGIIFSYSRAVWLSIALLLPVTIFILLKIRFRYLLAGGVIILALLFHYREPVMIRIESIQSERGTDIQQHAGSAANIQTSVSNRERINRWMSGMHMFREKPVTGFGPGTYPFQYGPFQSEENMTRLSTFFGDRGGIHSEYLKPLSETGLIGFLSFAGIILVILIRGGRLAVRSRDREVRIMAASLLLGLVTYYAHGFFNHFLHTDKVAVLFWGMTGFMVALDIRYRRTTNSTEGC